MSIYTQIERELVDINEARFELICNSFLFHEYRGQLHGIGTVKGKEKTRKGKPDAFIVQEDGTYIVAEYTTKNKSSNKRSFLEKLKADIDASLHFDNIGIVAERVVILVICCNSSLDIAEIEMLRAHVKVKNIKIRFVGIDNLVFFLTGEGRYYAYLHLNIPFETGQVLNKIDFLKFYNKRNLATPLDNPLVGRERELHSLVQMIEQHHVIIVTGRPGVGKSKLSLEAIDLFLKSNLAFHDYYIVSKTGSIVEDLRGMIKSGRKYLFFVDDANRQISNLINIIYSAETHDGAFIKIVATVRNYAKKQVISACQFLSTGVFQLGRLPKKSMAMMIADLNNDHQLSPYVTRIMDISNGIPRIAIMASGVIVHKQDAKLLKDASQIYEEYFQPIINDRKILADKDMLKSLGIISFFSSLDLESGKLRGILKNFNLAYDRFLDIVFELEEAELVQVYQNIVRISEQILATYAFYKAFIQDRVLDFETLLSKYCDRTFSTIKDIMGPVYDSFGEKDALTNINGILIRYFNKHQQDVAHCTRFLEVFGTSIIDQAFLFVNRHYSQKDDAKSPIKTNESSIQSFHPDYPILTILLPIIAHGTATECITAVALSVTYTEKDPQAFKTLLDQLAWRFCLRENDLPDGLSRQRTIYFYLLSNLQQGQGNSHLFFPLFRKVLLSNLRRKFFYIKTETGWKISPAVATCRQQYWEDINALFNTYSHLCSQVIEDYIADIPGTSITVLRYDEPYCSDILMSYYSPDDFQHCHLVLRYVNLLSNYYQPSNELNNLRQHFHNEAVTIFDILDAQNPFKKHETTWQMNEEKIGKLVVNTIDEFKYMYDLLLKSLPFRQYFNRLEHTLDFWVSKILEKDPTLGKMVLQYIVADGNKIQVQASAIFETSSAILGEKYNEIYPIISQGEFYYSNDWLNEYFNHLKPIAVTNYLTQELIRLFAESNHIHPIFSSNLDKYQSFDEDIHERVLLLFYTRVQRGDQFRFELREDFFEENTKLVKTYFEQCKGLYFYMKYHPYNYTFNYRYDDFLSGFFALYEVDSRILFDYLDYLKDIKEFSNHDDHTTLLCKIWNYSDAAVNIERIILEYKHSQDFEPSGHVACIFFQYLTEQDIPKVEAFLKDMLRKYNNDPEIVNIILDISRSCIRDIYLSIVAYFLHINDDFEVFRSLVWVGKWDANYDYTSAMEFERLKLSEIYHMIKDLPTPVKFIKHTEHLAQRIYSLSTAIADGEKWDLIEYEHRRRYKKERYF